MADTASSNSDASQQRPSRLMLVYLADAPRGRGPLDVRNLQRLTGEVLTESGVDAHIVDDLSGVQGEPCLAVKIPQTGADFEMLQAAARESGLRFVNGEEQVRELNSAPADPTKHEPTEGERP